MGKTNNFSPLSVSASHIDILKGNSQAGALAELYDGLQIVDFFGGDPHQVIHDRGLDL